MKCKICYGSVRCMDHLSLIEQKLRAALPHGLFDGTMVTITMTSGFENFSRGIPYHNYEDWGQGFTIEGFGIKYTHEYLDTAIDEWIKIYVNSLPDETPDLRKKVWVQKKLAALSPKFSGFATE